MTVNHGVVTDTLQAAIDAFLCGPEYGCRSIRSTSLIVTADDLGVDGKAVIRYEESPGGLVNVKLRPLQNDRRYQTFLRRQIRGVRHMFQTRRPVKIEIR